MPNLKPSGECRHISKTKSQRFGNNRFQLPEMQTYVSVSTAEPQQIQKELTGFSLTCPMSGEKLHLIFFNVSSSKQF